MFELAMRCLGITTMTILLATMFSCQQAAKEQDEEALHALAMELGEDISTRSQQALQARLLAAIDSGGVPFALQFCKVHAFPIMDSMQRKTGVLIKRAAERWRNPNDAPDSLEQAILDDYSSMIAQAEMPDERITTIDKQHLLYTKPIMVGAPLCLNCHGMPWDDITPANMELIHELYPDDRATGFRLGDLRGLWSIRFEKARLELLLEERNTESATAPGT